jgi:ribokinase
VAAVVVVGSANVDLVVRAPRHPVPGETLLGSGFATHAGGKGANQAVAAARAGARTALIGRMGPDGGADFLRGALTAAGVDISAVGTCRHDPTGTAVITVADSGENTIVVVPGANAMLRPVHIDDAVEDGLFDDVRVTMAQLEVPLDVVRHGFEVARSRGAMTMLNAAPMTDLPAGLLAVTDVLVVNETELEQLTGSSSASFDVARWGALGAVSSVVLTLGGDGAVVLRRGQAAVATGGHRVEVVDTTAAGDTFCGYLAASLADGESVDDAVIRANAAAALACTKAGAQPSIPTADEVRALLARTRP